MTNEYIIDKFKILLGDDYICEEVTYNMLSITVNSKAILDVALRIYQEDMGFTFLTDLTGVHYPDEVGKELGVIYHFHNLVENVRIRVKCFFPKNNPVISTLTSVHAGANWMERETYDFFGIIFEGHPNLKRILNVDEMDYYPMLKEYPLEDQTRTDKQDKYFGR